MAEVIEIRTPAVDLETGEGRTVVVEVGQRGPRGPQGEIGPEGPRGPEGPMGPIGPAGNIYEQPTAFASPSAVWEIDHTIPLEHPAVHAYDINDRPIFGDVSYPTPTSVRIEWAWPMAGRVVLTT